MLNKEEMETVIQFDRCSKTCKIYTSDKSVMRKLDKLYPIVNKTFLNGEIVSQEYETQKKFISFRADPSYQGVTFPKKSLTAVQLTNLEKARQKSIELAKNKRKML